MPGEDKRVEDPTEPGSEADIDEQFRALLEGLRTTIPGVMVLFSFLLLLPLQRAFADLRGVDRALYYVAFYAASVAMVLLIAPSVHQRVRGPISGIRRRTWSHVMTATKLAIVGTFAFLIAVGAVVYLVSTLLFTDQVAAVATAVIVGVAVWAWAYLPLVSFERDDG